LFSIVDKNKVRVSKISPNHGSITVKDVNALEFHKRFTGWLFRFDLCQ